MKLLRHVLTSVLLSLLSSSPLWAAPSQLTYQGRIVKSDGTPLQYNNVSFIFQLTDPTGQCVVYQEQVNGINLTNSNGIFDVPIGKGTISFPSSGSFTVLDAFNNSMNLNCQGSAIPYTPAVDDTRKLRVQFFDGVGWQTISPDTVIRSVPFAGYALSARKLGTNVAGDFVLKSDINNSGSGSVSCNSGSFLTWDATAMKFGCSSTGSGSGTVTSVSGTAPLMVTNASTTPTIALAKSSASADGYLASSDWTTFNNKQNALGFTPLNPANNLSELASTAATARGNLGLGSASVKNVPASGDAAATEVVLGSDSRLTNSRPPSGSAGGDLAGSYPNPTLVNVVTAGSGIKISYDAKGRVTGATGLAASDIPGLDWSKIISGTPTTLSGYGITNGIINAGSVPSIQSGSDATRLGIASPAANSVFITTDTKIIFQYLSGTWVPVASNAGTGGTITALTGDVSASGSGAVAATVNSVGGSTAASVHSAELAANAATNTNSNSTLVKRDGSGGFSAGAVSLSSLVLRDSGSNTVSLQAPSTVGTSYVLRLPAAATATNNSVLASDTAGNLSWINLGSVAGTIDLTSQVTGLLPLANGGTGASSATGARSNLGLGSAATVNTGSSAGTIPLLGTGGLVANQMCVSDGTASSIICNSTIPVSSQWVSNGSNIYYNSGNVGIGTSSPATSLHIISTQSSSSTHPDRAGLVVEAEGTNVGGENCVKSLL